MPKASPSPTATKVETIRTTTRFILQYPYPEAFERRCGSPAAQHGRLGTLIIRSDVASVNEKEQLFFRRVVLDATPSHSTEANSIGKYLLTHKRPLITKNRKVSHLAGDDRKRHWAMSDLKHDSSPFLVSPNKAHHRCCAFLSLMTVPIAPQ